MRAIHPDSDRPRRFREPPAGDGRIVRARRRKAEKALKAASVILETPEDQLELNDGRVRIKGGNRSIDLGEIARALRGAPGYAFPGDIEPGLESSAQWRTDALAYANACHIAEVEVTPELGHVEIRRYIALNDSGRMINPMIVEGQILGGVRRTGLAMRCMN